jgi:hypothetical protein
MFLEVPQKLGCGLLPGHLSQAGYICPQDLGKLLPWESKHGLGGNPQPLLTGENGLNIALTTDKGLEHLAALSLGKGHLVPKILDLSLSVSRGAPSLKEQSHCAFFALCTWNSGASHQAHPVPGSHLNRRGSRKRPHGLTTRPRLADLGHAGRSKPRGQRDVNRSALGHGLYFAGFEEAHSRRLYFPQGYCSPKPDPSFRGSGLRSHREGSLHTERLNHPTWDYTDLSREGINDISGSWPSPIGAQALISTCKLDALGLFAFSKRSGEHH